MQCQHHKLGQDVMQDVLSSIKKKFIDLHVLDFKQCFDALWFEESLKDMFEGGNKHNMLPFLYEAGRNVNITGKTPSGI